MSLKTLSRSENLLNGFWEPWNNWFSNGFADRAITVPAVNITENKTSYELSLAAPGLHKKDFDISVNGTILTISGKKENTKEDSEIDYTRQEYSYSSFSRSFTLPEEIEADKIEAKYDGGVLKLSLPKDGKKTKKLGTTISIK